MSLLIAIAIAVCLAVPRPAQLAIPADAPHGIPVPKGHGSMSSGTDAARASEPLVGRASWYPAPGSVAAAGPRLRRALGPNWRGQWVRVCAGECVTVKLTDFCQCYRGTSRERLLDLNDDDFSVLAPLSSGIVRVRISVLVPPATDR